ncbi:MAG: flagellar biosynthesis protein FlhA [Candidatus Sericytochromatia bacterium]|nr:flagellar biosynthesis protein FlhA [Candidatus Sericytochromatia bacterium]
MNEIMQRLNGWLGPHAGSVKALTLPVVVVLMLAMMVLPLPPFVLDLLFTFNIAIALMVVMVSAQMVKPLDFAALPTVLLVTTLLRLSLNVASTRVVLLEGHNGPGAAGAVIESFGHALIGGNFAVGLIVFAILVVINFIVVTKGAERIAEVGARFTLDAMPGKQMAIDADLNAGLITETEARQRRAVIQRESDFYGTMDGASKFVRGDAVAGIIIIIVNIVGGLTIGVLQRGMSLSDAASRYTLLTVGDGLVTQIPALVISVGTGILVSKAATEASLGNEIGSQVLGDPRVLGAVAGMIGVLGLVPGLPKLPFLTLAALAGVAAYVANQTRERAAVAAELAATTPAETGDAPKGPENVMNLLAIDPMELEIGYRMIPLVDAAQGGDLLERITMIRRQTATKLGLVLPPIRVRDNLQLKPKEYRINLRGIEIARGDVQIDHLLAMNAGMAVGPIDGIPTKEPVFGLPAFWIPESQREEAEVMGYTVFDPSSVVATHLTEVVKQHAADVLTRQDVQALLNNVKTEYPAVVEELYPAIMSAGEIQRVLQNLLRERVSIRDLVPILEALANYGRLTKDTDTLTEYARQSLARAITHQYQNPQGQLPVLTLDPGLEQVLANAVQQTDQGAFVSLDPGLAGRLLKNLQAHVERLLANGQQPVVLCSSKVRLVFRRLIERKYPQVAVMAYNEIVPPQIEVHALGTLSLN